MTNEELAQAEDLLNKLIHETFTSGNDEFHGVAIALNAIRRRKLQNLKSEREALNKDYAQAFKD